MRRRGGKSGKAIAMAVMLMLVSGRAMAADNATTAQPVHRIVISVKDRKLALVEGGQVKKVFPVAVGARITPSPEGEFKIINRITNPTYYHAGKVIPAGKANPLGNRWMGLNKKGYGIHGTNQPKSIGKAASHGCIRMAKKDLDELFTMVEIGDAVEIVAEPDAQVAQAFDEQTEPVVTATAEAGATVGGQ